MAFSTRLVRSFSTSSMHLALAKMPLQLFGLDGRYATALYSAAVKKQTLDNTEKEIKKVYALFNEDKKFHAFVLDPTIKRPSKKAALQEILKKLGCNEVAQNFFATVADNGRLGKIDGIFKAFEKLMSAHRGEVVCEVVTAKAIDEATLKEVTGALQGFIKSNEKLHVSTKVDPSILGGMIVSIGDKYVDMSVATKIKQYTKIIEETV